MVSRGRSRVEHETKAKDYRYQSFDHHPNVQALLLTEKMLMERVHTRTRIRFEQPRQACEDYRWSSVRCWNGRPLEMTPLLMDWIGLSGAALNRSGTSLLKLPSEIQPLLKPKVLRIGAWPSTVRKAGPFPGGLLTSFPEAEPQEKRGGEAEPESHRLSATVLRQAAGDAEISNRAGFSRDDKGANSATGLPKLVAHGSIEAKPSLGFANSDRMRRPSIVNRESISNSKADQLRQALPNMTF